MKGYAFDARRLETECAIHNDALIDINVGLTLASGKYPDRDIVIARVGFSFYASGMLFTGYYGVKPGLWKQYNNESYNV